MSENTENVNQNRQGGEHGGNYSSNRKKNYYKNKNRSGRNNYQNNSNSQNSQNRQNNQSSQNSQNRQNNQSSQNPQNRQNNQSSQNSQNRQNNQSSQNPQNRQNYQKRNNNQNYYKGSNNYRKYNNNNRSGDNTSQTEKTTVNEKPFTDAAESSARNNMQKNEQSRPAERVTRPEQKQSAERVTRPEQKQSAERAARPEQKQSAERAAKPEQKQSAERVTRPEQKQSAERAARPEQKQSAEKAARPEQKQSAERAARPEQKQSAERVTRPEQKQSAERAARPEQKQSAERVTRPEQKQSAERVTRPEQKQSAEKAARPEQKQSAERVTRPEQKQSAERVTRPEQKQSAERVTRPEQKQSAERVTRPEQKQSAERVTRPEQKQSAERVTRPEQKQSAEKAARPEQKQSAERVTRPEQKQSAEKAARPEQKQSAEKAARPEQKQSAERAARPEQKQSAEKTAKSEQKQAVRSVSHKGEEKTIVIERTKPNDKETTPRADEEHTTVFKAVKDDTQPLDKKSAGESENKKEEVSIYRQKSDRHFWARLFSLAAILPIYFVLLICAVFLPRSTVSNIEKRNLAAKPEFSWEDYWSGKYTADVANYFDDTVPFRDALKQAASRFTGIFGIKYNDVQINGAMEVVNPKPKDNDKTAEKEKPVSAVSAVSNASGSTYGDSLAGNPNVSKQQKDKSSDTDTEKQIKGEEIAEGVYANGVIVVYQDGHYRAMSMYGGGSGDEYVSALNGYARDLPGVRVYSLVAPTASEFYTPKNFSDYNASQEDDIVSMNDRLQNVTGINVCPALLSHKKENIYTRTDHHWMSLGAYYAAKEFSDAAGVSFLDISQYTKITKPDYVGTLYTFSGNNPDLLNDPEDFVYYVPKKQDYKTEYYDQAYNYVYEGDLFANVEVASEYYTMFISGDSYCVKVSTSVKNGRRCIIVKDSYGNALVPFMTGSFEEVYVVDMRYFERNLVDFAREMNITDLLFTCCSYSAVGPNADNLEALRTGGITGSTASPEPETSSEETDKPDRDNTEDEDRTQPERSEEHSEPGLYTADDENIEDGNNNDNNEDNEYFEDNAGDENFEDEDY